MIHDQELSEFNHDTLLVSDLIELFEGQYTIENFDERIKQMVFKSAGMKIALMLGHNIRFEILGRTTEWNDRKAVMDRESMVQFFARKKALAHQYYHDDMAMLINTADRAKTRIKMSVSFRAKDSTTAALQVMLVDIVLFEIYEFLSDKHLDMAFDVRRNPEPGTFAFYIKDNEVQDDDTDIHLNPKSSALPAILNKRFEAEKRCFLLLSLLARECDITLRRVTVSSVSDECLPDLPIYRAMQQDSVYMFLEFTTR